MTETRAPSRLSPSSVQRQIDEMWSAIEDIPHVDPDRDRAIEDARKVERDLCAKLDAQDRLDAAAPELLDVAYRVRQALQRGCIFPEDLNLPALALAAIAKAEGAKP